jgi:hypothetical protein
MRESSTRRWCTGTRRTPEWRTRLTVGIDKCKKLRVLLRKHVVDARRALRASHLSKGYPHLRSTVPGSRDNLTGLFDTAVHCVLLRSTLSITSWFGVDQLLSGYFPTDLLSVNLHSAPPRIRRIVFFGQSHNCHLLSLIPSPVPRTQVILKDFRHGS